MSRDVVTGILILLASIGYYWMATQLPISLIDTSVNSSALPRALGLFGAGLSIVLIVQGVIRQRRAAAAPGTATGGEGGWLQHRRAAGIVAIAIGYVVVLRLFGYAVAIGLSVLAIALYQSAFYKTSRPLTTTLIVAGAAAAIFWAIFEKLLGIRMPVGVVWQYLF